MFNMNFLTRELKESEEVYILKEIYGIREINECERKEN